MFQKLIGVSGIGPSLAIKILSGLAGGGLDHGDPQGRGGSAGAHSGCG
jgi:hypothetical protein